MASQQDQDDLLDALFAMNQATGRRPSILRAQLKYFPDWSGERLFDAAKALEADGDILALTPGGLFDVDLSSTARKKVAARSQGSRAQASSTTYNIGSVHNSPFQHVAAGAHRVQNTTYEMRNDLRAIVDLYRQHVEELNLDATTRRKADAQVATIEAQLIDEPDPSIVRTAGKSLKAIIEGAIAGAIGTTIANPGVWAPLLSLFS